jgi:hypothetical protein
VGQGRWTLSSNAPVKYRFCHSSSNISIAAIFFVIMTNIRTSPKKTDTVGGSNSSDSIIRSCSCGVIVTIVIINIVVVIGVAFIIIIIFFFFFFSVINELFNGTRNTTRPSMDKQAVAERAVKLGTHIPAVLTNSVASKRTAGKGPATVKRVSKKKAATAAATGKAKVAAAAAIARTALNSLLVHLPHRRVVENPVVISHCFFDATSLSNHFTAGMPAKRGAK